MGKKLSGGQAVVESLAANGVEVIFGIPSAHSIAIYDALYNYPKIRHITTRHEQGAAYMADGYARASGKTGVCLTSAGPGALNSITAMAEAYTSSSPIINITTQINTSLLGKDKGVSHETRDQLGMFRLVTGWNKRVESIKDISPSIREAFQRLKTVRPRPIELEFPVNVLQTWDDVDVLEPTYDERYTGDPGKIDQAAEILASSKRPIVWAGGGVISAGATAELIRLAEALQAPVLTSGMGKTVMSWDHPLYLGTIGRGGQGFDSPESKSLIVGMLQKADVILVVGSRLNSADTINWTIPLPEKLIQVDIEETQLGKNYPCSLGIKGDAKAVLVRLLQKLGADRKEASQAADALGIKETIYQNGKLRGPQEVQMMEDIRSIAGPDAIVSVDITTATYWSRMFLKDFYPRTEMAPRGFNGLGFALPAGIGAKVACPDKTVIVMVGDGGFLFTGQELATAVQFGINVKVIIFDDNSYGIISSMQNSWFDNRRIGVELRNPDFVKFAESFGAGASRVSSLSGVRDALSEALKSENPSVIVVTTSPRSDVYDTQARSPMSPRPSD